MQVMEVRVTEIDTKMLSKPSLGEVERMIDDKFKISTPDD